MKFIAYGVPVPKARARPGRQGGFYTPSKTRVYEQEIAWAVRAKGYRFDETPLSLHAQFHMPSARRVDGDNLLKSLLDGCQKGELFADDKQVIEFSARVFYNSKNPRTTWEVEPQHEHPHMIFCDGVRSAVQWDSGEWRCASCGEPVAGWMVRTDFVSR